MNALKEICIDHFYYRKQLWQLSKSELKKKYKGSLLGWLWIVIKPAITIFVYWFAFSIGLRKGGDVDGYPYFLWLLSGMIPWFYMRDAFIGGVSSLRRYTYLITKIKFPISTIPTFVNMALLIINILLIGIMIIIFMAFGYYPDIYYIQIPIYFMMMAVFFSLWGLFSGILGAVSRDFSNLIKSLSMALFWLSGIMYNVDKISVEWIKDIMLFNPITIVVNGFRNSLIYKNWIWENPIEIRNFFIVTAIMMLLSVWVYRKLRKDVPDVL